MRLCLHRGWLTVSTKEVPVGADIISDLNSLQVSSLLLILEMSKWSAGGLQTASERRDSVFPSSEFLAPGLGLSFLPYTVCPQILNLEQKRLKGFQQLLVIFLKPSSLEARIQGDASDHPLENVGSPETRLGPEHHLSFYPLGLHVKGEFYC